MAVTATISAQVQNMITARFALAGDMGGQPSSGAGMIRQGGLGLKAPDLNVDGMLFGTFVAVGSASTPSTICETFCASSGIP